MKQVLQDLRTGAIELAEIPCPRVPPRHLLIRTTRSLISAGTERMLLDFGRGNVIDKTRQQPDKVRLVLDKMRTDGVVSTLKAVQHKLDQPLPLGYCNVGVVLEVGSGVTGFAAGDRVACNGKHAEVVSVPMTLCARIPDGVTDDAAAFTVVGAIALQGIRLLQPTMGESMCVIGLGLIGQLTVQLLRAQGCRVLGIDPDPLRLELAGRAGAEVVAVDGDPLSAADRFSRGRGIDGVIVTAATKSHEPIQQAARMCRKRGRIVLVGVTGMELSREEFYKKELSFQVSCSYGPGRYDPSYEDQGHDYPIGYVRWTEQRNFEAVLDAMADGRLQVAPLVSHRFGLDDAGDAYDVVATRQPSLGLLFEYPTARDNSADGLRTRRVVLIRDRVEDRPTTSPGVAFVGSGSYATGVLIPAFKATGARLVSVVSSTGISAMHAGRRFGFREATTDVAMALDDPAVQAMVIATRHDSHADLVLQSLQAGKAIFVEKPLCLTLEELAEIESRYARSAHPLVMIGFNRRFAPQVRRIKALLEGSGPKSFVMTVNAGAVAIDHWTQDREVGGGRIIGEACHFIDLLRFLAGFPIVDQGRVAMSSRSGDTQTIHLRFQDGSIGTVHYFANGTRAFPKERLEVFSDGRVLQLDNFRKLRAFGWSGFKHMNRWRQDKGQRACATAFLDAVRSGGPSPIPFDEIVEVSRTAIALA